MEPLKIPVAEIPLVCNESLAVVYDAIKCGHLETMLVGRRRFARPAAIRKWVDFLEAESKAGRPVSYRARKRPDLPGQVAGAPGRLQYAMKPAAARPAPGDVATGFAQRTDSLDR
jgi:hypothetical protein